MCVFLEGLLLKHGNIEDLAIKDLPRSFCFGILVGGALRHLLRNDISVSSFFSHTTSSKKNQDKKRKKANIYLKQVNYIPVVFFYTCISATVGIVYLIASAHLQF